MTVKIIKETAATAEDVARKNVDGEGTSTSPVSTSERPGLLMASLVLLALTTAGAIGAVPLASYPDRRRLQTAESATISLECDQELLEQVRDLFERGSYEFFRDGMYSAFSKALIRMLKQHGNMAVKAIAEYLFSGVANPAVVSEALRWLADFNDPTTLPQRWVILQQMLQDPSPKIRDGAVLGFAALDDPRARPLLFKALDNENIGELQHLIEKVVEQLNATNATLASHS